MLSLMGLVAMSGIEPLTCRVVSPWGAFVSTALPVSFNRHIACFGGQAI